MAMFDVVIGSKYWCWYWLNK